MKKSLFILLFLPSFLLAGGGGDGPRPEPWEEIGFLAGGSFYRGDLNLFDNFLRGTLPGVGLYYRHCYNPRIAWRQNIFYGNVKADDAKSRSLWQQQRNLNFRSPIIEVSSQIEINFLEFKLPSAEKTDNDATRASTYIFAGLGAFYFNPQGYYNGNWVNLQPLSTEGQGTLLNKHKPYHRVAAVMPMGIGFKCSVDRRTSFSVEWGMRKTATDYLDDVSTVYVDPAQLTVYKNTTAAALSDRSKYIDPTISNLNGRQRGNSANKDWYSFFGFSLAFKIHEPAAPCASYGK